jgi:hypothetical protein
VAHSLNAWLSAFNEVAIHLLAHSSNAVVKKHTPLSQLFARANRSLLGLLVQELGLIKLYQLFL